MGGKRYSGPRPIPLISQRMQLLKRYPGTECYVHKTTLVWRGRLCPTEYSPTYEVLLDHRIGRSPVVFVVSPELTGHDGDRLQHVFPHNTLCLHTQDRDWIASKPLANTIVPWTSEWLFYHEVWKATGEWLGGGVHPQPRQAPIARDRPERKRGPSTKERLIEAALIAYGPDADLEVVLANAA